MNKGKSRNLHFVYRLIILSFLTLIGLTLFFFLILSIVQEPAFSAMKILGIIGITGTITPVFVSLFRSYIKQEIDTEKAKILEENRKFNNQPGLNNSDSSIIEMAINVLNTIVAEHPELPEKKNLISLVNELSTLQSTKSYQMTKVWLENIDNLQSIAKRSGNMALKADPYPAYMIFNDKNKAKESLYYNIYCCLLWIQRSFKVGDYLSTHKLPKILDTKRTISALNMIKTEILTKELQEELGIYFDELVNLIPTL